MKNNKAVALLISTTVAAFAAGMAHAGELSKVKDLSGGILVAEEGGEHGCSGKEGGCSAEGKAAMKGKHGKKHGHKKGAGAEKKGHENHDEKPAEEKKAE